VWVPTPRAPDFNVVKVSGMRCNWQTFFHCELDISNASTLKLGDRGWHEKTKTNLKNNQEVKTTGKLFSINRRLDQEVEGLLARIASPTACV
jgi:hypothetical protein